MNVYIETNFILELAFLQEQHESCDKILAACEAGRHRLVLPIFCIAEAYTTLVRQAKKREQLANELVGELRQLSRSAQYKGQADPFREASRLLLQSSQDEEQRLIQVLDRILKIADIISLEAEIIAATTRRQAEYSLDAQDSIIFSSV